MYVVKYSPFIVFIQVNSKTITEIQMHFKIKNVISVWHLAIFPCDF